MEGKDQYIVRYLKRHTIFLDSEARPPKAYGVLSLITEFKEMFRGQTPVMVEAALLPFKSRIIHDGMLQSYPLFFGRGIREEIDATYQEAKHRFGIIESLPPPRREERKTAEERLKFYLKNQRNRAVYRDEIQQLRSKSKDLGAVYYRETGKRHARQLGRRLRDLGFEAGWFAILDDTVVASGATREEVKHTVREIVPKERQNHIYLFRLK